MVKLTAIEKNIKFCDKLISSKKKIKKNIFTGIELFFIHIYMIFYIK